jgi:single-strand DNA-binding protein
VFSEIAFITERSEFMNSVNLIGRLTRDPELRKTEEGRSICTFSIAIDDIHSKEDRADFLRITVFGNPGDLCERYLRKGFLTGVSGRLRSDSYTDSEGITRTSVNVIAENVRFLQWPERSGSDDGKSGSAAVEAAQLN